MWASTEAIPNGWSVCDTTNNTPDFTDRYPIGTVNKAEIGQPIGASSHVHSFTGVTEGANMGKEGGQTQLLNMKAMADTCTITTLMVLLQR